MLVCKSVVNGEIVVPSIRVFYNQVKMEMSGEIDRLEKEIPAHIKF